MKRSDAYRALLQAMRDDVPGFDVRYKTDHWHQRFIRKLMFWFDYNNFITTIYPHVYFPDHDYDRDYFPVETMEHEWVHLKDWHTFFGLLPWVPGPMNAMAMSCLYLFPQILAIGALLAPLNPWLLLCLVFLLPIPAPFRALIEVRAYRRSIELGEDLEQVMKNFTGPTYYYMMPFPRLMNRWLVGPSPYVEQMDTYLGE